MEKDVKTKKIKVSVPLMTLSCFGDTSKAITRERYMYDELPKGNNNIFEKLYYVTLTLDEQNRVISYEFDFDTLYATAIRDLNVFDVVHKSVDFNSEEVKKKFEEELNKRLSLLADMIEKSKRNDVCDSLKRNFPELSKKVGKYVYGDLVGFYSVYNSLFQPNNYLSTIVERFPEYFVDVKMNKFNLFVAFKEFEMVEDCLEKGDISSANEHLKYVTDYINSNPDNNICLYNYALDVVELKRRYFALLSKYSELDTRQEVSVYLADWELLPETHLNFNGVQKAGDVIATEVRKEDVTALMQFLREKYDFNMSHNPIAIIKGKNSFKGWYGFIYSNGNIIVDNFANLPVSGIKEHAAYIFTGANFERLSGLRRYILMHNRMVPRVIHSGDWKSRKEEYMLAETSDEEKLATNEMVKRLKKDRN